VARTSLDSVLNGNFIKQIGAAGSGSPGSIKSFGSQPFGSEESSKVNFASSLRIGARTFANAIEGVNIAISYVNLGREVLSELLDVTDKLIAVTDKASRSGIGRQQRSRLNEEFSRLAKDFEKIVQGSSLAGTDALTRDGLEELFVNLGLDTKKSKGLAGLFAEFAIVDSDLSLASQASKAERPIRIPESAFMLAKGGVSYNVSQSAVSLPTEGLASTGISGATAVYVVGENTVDPGGPDTVIVESPGLNSSGINEAMLLPGLTSDITIKAVNSNSGMYVFSTTSSLIDDTGGSANLFLADSRGNVVRQITTFTGGGAVEYGDVALSDDGSVVIFSSLVGLNSRLAIADFTDPENPDYLTIEELPGTPVNGFAEVAISSDGQSFAFQFSDSGQVTGGTLASPGDLISVGDFYGGGYHPNGLKLGFLSNDALMIAYTEDEGTAAFQKYQFGDDATSVIALSVADLDFNSISLVTNSQGAFDPQIVYIDSNTNDVMSIVLDEHSELVGFTRLLEKSAEQALADYEFTGKLSASFSRYGQVNLGFEIENQGSELFTAFFASGEDQSMEFSDFLEGFSLEGMFIGGAVTSASNQFNPDYLSSSTIFLESTKSALDSVDPGEISILGTSASGQFSVVLSENQLIAGGDPIGGSQRGMFLIDQYGKAVAEVGTFDSSESVSASVDDLGNIYFAASGEERFDLGVFSTADFVSYNPTSALSMDGELKSFAHDPFDSSKTVFSYEGLGGEQVVGSFDSGGAVTLYSDGNQYNQVYSSNGVVAAVRQNGLTQELVLLNDATNTFDTVLLGGINQIGEFQVLKQGDAETVFMVEDRGTNTITLFRESDMQNPYKVFLSQGSEVSMLKLQTTQVGSEGFGFELLMQGENLQLGTNALGSGLFRIQIEGSESEGKKISRSLPEYERIFSSGRTIETRPRAYQALADLKELRAQIKTNLDVTEELSGLLNKNVDLLRAAGNAFLELSSSLRSVGDAESLAFELRNLIRRNAPQALSQAENLNSLVVAALANDYQGLLHS